MANHALDDMNNMLEAASRMATDAGSAHGYIQGLNQNFDGMANTRKVSGLWLVMAPGEQYV
jgi:hypothetical protein